MRSSDGPASCAGGSNRRYAFAVGSNYSDDEILDSGRTPSGSGSSSASSAAISDPAWHPTMQQLRRRKSEDYGRCSSERPFGFAVELNDSSGTTPVPVNCYLPKDELNDTEVESLFTPHRSGVYSDQRGCWGAASQNGGQNSTVSGGLCALLHCSGTSGIHPQSSATSGYGSVHAMSAPFSSSALHSTTRSHTTAVYCGGPPSADARQEVYGQMAMSSRSSCGCSAAPNCHRMLGDRPTVTNDYRQRFIERFSSLSNNSEHQASDCISKKTGGGISDMAEIHRQLEHCYADGGYRERRSIVLPPPYGVIRNTDDRRKPSSAEPEVIVMRRNGCSGGRTLPSSVVYFYERASICDPFPLPSGHRSNTSSSTSVNSYQPPTASKLGNRKYSGSRRNETIAHVATTLPTTENGDVIASATFVGGLRRVNSLVSGTSSSHEVIDDVDPTAALNGGTAASRRRYHHHQGGYRRYPSGCGTAADEGFDDEGRILTVGTSGNALSECGNVVSGGPKGTTTGHVTGHVCCRCRDEPIGSSSSALMVGVGASSSSSSTSSSSAAGLTASSATGSRSTNAIVLPPLSDRNRKRSYRVGLNLFNKNPELGIAYLRDREFLDHRPSATAKFLIARKGLSKQMIGEYLGEYPTPFLSQVLRSFAQQIDVSNLEIDVALRKFQTFFRMPGEAQKIERIIEVFASQYCLCNPDIAEQFASTDTVFLLSFAIMMLNTDLHNRNVRQDKKMKIEDFIRNLRGVDGGSDVDPVLLTSIYERIKAAEFAPGEDHVTQVVRVEQMLIGKKPPLSTVLYRRLVCYCRLQEITDPARRQRSTQHQREVFLFNDILLVAKVVGRHKNSLSYSYRQSFSLTSMGVYLFEAAYYHYGVCLTNTSNNKVHIMLIARNEHDRKNFVEDLKEAILENAEMLSVESERSKPVEVPSPLTLGQVKVSGNNVNRYSNDSGVVDVDLVRSPEMTTLLTVLDGQRSSSANVGTRSRPHSVLSGSDHGSAASLDSGQSQGHASGASINIHQRRIN